MFYLIPSDAGLGASSVCPHPGTCVRNEEQGSRTAPVWEPVVKGSPPPGRGTAFCKGIAETVGPWDEGLELLHGVCDGSQETFPWKGDGAEAESGHGGVCFRESTAVRLRGEQNWSRSLPLCLLLHGGFHAPGRRGQPLCCKGLLGDLVALLTFAPVFPSLNSTR